MRKGLKIFVIVAFAVLSTFPAAAHHSFAVFDRGEGMERSISGVVKEFSIVNPHGWFKIVVLGQDDRAVLWSFEMAAVAALQRLGWTKDVIAPGDKVTVTYYPLRVGSNGGEFISVALPSGRTLKGLMEGDRGFPFQPQN